MKTTLFTLLFFALLGMQAQNSCQPPVYYFNNMSTLSGNGGVNSSYKFTSVLSGIDAFVTITGMQNASISNSNMDNSSGYPIAWQPFITFPSSRSSTSDTSYIEFRIQFKSNASPFDLVDQQCMAMTIVDCDGNGNSNGYREMMKVSLPGEPMGIQSSSITVFEDQNWILFKSGFSQFNNIDTLNVAAMGQVNFEQSVNTFYMRVGVVGPVSANTTRQFSFYFRSFAALSIPLPVHIASLEAEKEEDLVHLSWLSTFEQNFRSFEIYRSLDGKQFDFLSEINGNGNSKSVNSYRYIDRDNEILQSGNVFYKLKMNDLDGKSIWSHTVSINGNDMIGDKGGSFSLYPNPAADQLNVIMHDMDDYKAYSVKDIYGKTILEGNDIGDDNAISLNIRDMVAGVYTIQFTSDNGNTQIGKFIKN